MEKTIVSKSGSMTALENIGKSLILKILGKLDKGRLDVLFPDGQRASFGNPGTLSSDEIYASLSINDNRFFSAILLNGDIGLGESYVESYWDSPRPELVLEWFIANIEKLGMASGSQESVLGLNLLKVINRAKHLMRGNTKKMASQNIFAHYDLGNEFFKTFLDRTMAYSCAVFESPEQELEEAQINKFKKICESLDLRPGMSVLEIGCGWGGLACYMAENFQVKVTGITISNEQFRFAKDKVIERGLQDLVEIKICDYRDVKQKYDRVVSIEMAEAVGHEFLPTYFKTINNCLTPNGLAVLQVITSPDSRYDQFRTGVDWIQTHIFPGSLLPSVGRMNECLRDTQLHFYEMSDIGLHYAETLKRWRFNLNSNLQRLKELRLDNTFIRKWNYYLYYCEAAFRSRNISTVQLTLIKPNNKDARWTAFN